MIWNLISKAKDLFYNNKTSGLSATDVQGAIDELDGVLDTRNLKTYTNVTQLGLTLDNTLDEIFDALPSGSQLVTMIQQGKNLGGTLPNSDTSELVVTKGNSERATAVLTSYVISARRINRCYGGVWTGWKILVTQDELDSRLDAKVTNSFTANRVLITNSSGEVAAAGEVTSTELGYLNGVTSNIQTQFDNIGSVLNAAPTAQASVANDGVITSLSIPKGGKWIITGYASGHKVLLKTDNGNVWKHGTNPLVYASTSSAAITIKMANASGASQTIYADASQYYITAIRIG